jgi:NADPH-dependent 2,4-dienoyl-CoA reductase/sulfur reductase-like enzyme
VVIVGGGHAGGRTAERLRHRGFTGPIDVIGMEKELPYERPPLSKSVLTSPQLPANAYLLPEGKWGEAGVRFHLGAEAVRIDREAKKVLLSSGTALPYRKLVLATGLSPRRLGALDPVSETVFYLRSFEDAKRLRSGIAPGVSMVLIGAGLIGLEVAASASKLGAHVTIVETASRPLGRLMPPALSTWFDAIHRDAGVRVLYGRTIAGSKMSGAGALVTLDDGIVLRADIILVAIGGSPNDELARGCGIATSNGVLVNEFGQTSDPDVYAVGDVAFHVNPLFGTGWRLESWKNAEDQAEVAASHICGERTPYCEVPWFWTDQYDFNVQVAGVLGEDEPSFERGSPGDHGYLAYFMKGDRLTGAIGIGCGRDVRIARETIKAGRRLSVADLLSKGFAVVRTARVEDMAS